MTRTTLVLPFAALLAVPATASALEIGVRVEPGLAVPLTAPQTQRFKPGGEVAIKGYLGLGHYVDVQAGISLLGLVAGSGTTPSTMGTAWSDSLGLRLKRRHDASPGRGGFAAGSPWIDGEGLYVRTGGLDRFGLTVGAGVSFPLEVSRVAWLGPFVRYMQIVEPAHQGFDDRDAKVLFVGLNLEIGTSPLPPPFILPPPTVECPICTPVAVVPMDRDHDGSPDAMDTCPDVAGPIENHGCPIYKKIIVRPDRLELREKIMFAFDRADIGEESFPLLDEVVQALKDNKGFRVQMEGHTDSTGPAEHNQTLSEHRADTVLTYLRSHGIAAERLSSKGFGSSEPTDTDKTVVGRENNRRVDFVVEFKIIDRSAQ